MEKRFEEWCPGHITTGVAAECCGVSKTTVLRWIKKGRLPAFRLPEGHYRIQRGYFGEFLTKHGIPVPNRASKNKSSRRDTQQGKMG